MAIYGADDADPDWRSWLALLLLTASFTLSFADRYILAMMIEPIKADLQLSDVQIGILSGFAFTAFYALFALPMGALADRGKARAVIVGSLLCWSVATAFCGFARNFVQLAVARFLVGAGEAGCSPASQAILTGIFRKKHLALALAILGASGSLGLTLAFATGGYLEPRIGWQMTFLVAASPGPILALAIRFLVPTNRDESRRESPGGRTSLASYLDMRKNRLFIQMPFLFAAITVLQQVQIQWLPAYMERSFGIPRAELGARLALWIGPAMLAGTIVGGALADRLRARDSRWPMRVIGLSVLFAVPPSFILYLTDDPNVAFGAVMFASFFIAMPVGPNFSTVQRVVRPDQRAFAAAICLIVPSFLALGLGPLFVGFLSDTLASRFGADSLRWALFATFLLAVPWALFHVMIMSQRIKSSVSEP